MRRRLLENGEGGIDPSMANACDVVFAKNDGSGLSIFEETNWPSTGYTPISVVVIPGSHNVYGTGQCGSISLKAMNCTTPSSGSSETVQSMIWGRESMPSSAYKYKRVAASDTNTSNISDYLATSGYLPIQEEIGATPTRSKSSYLVSPYSGSDYKTGGHNTYYSTKSFDTSDKKNALSNFDGVRDTQIMLNVRGSRDYTTWKPNYTTPGDYPGISCCDMFYTIGTKQGDWYLPSIAELGYIAPRMADINNTYDKLRNKYGESCGIPLAATLMSSTWLGYESYWNQIWIINNNTGNLFSLFDLTNPSQRRPVRAFLRV